MLFAVLGLECAACSTWIVVSFFLRAGEWCEIENAIQVERFLQTAIGDEKLPLADGVVPTAGYLARKKDDLIRAGLGKALEDFFRRINMPTNLRELGVTVTEEDLVTMAQKCAVGVGGSKGSARLLYEEDMLAILRASM